MIAASKLKALLPAAITTGLLALVPSAAMASAPTASAGNANSNDAASEHLSGIVNPGGESTTVRFEWDAAGSDFCAGAGTASHTTANQTVSDSSSPVFVDDISGLTPGNNYCFGVFASNASSPTGVHSLLKTFTAGVPLAATTGSRSVSATSTDIEGVVNPAAQETSVKAEYAPSTDDFCTHNGQGGSPSATTLADTGLNDTDNHGVHVTIAELTAGTTYCAALVGHNASGDSPVSSLVSFTAGSPEVHASPSNVDATSVQLRGQIDPAGQATTSYSVKWGTPNSAFCSSFGSNQSDAHTVSGDNPGDIPADGDFHDVTVNVTGLTNGDRDCFLLTATNASASSRSVMDFDTVGLPEVNSEVFDFDGTTLTLNSATNAVNPVGQATTYFIQYALESSSWCQSEGTSGSPDGQSPPQPLGTTATGFHPVSLTFSGFAQNTSYCFRLAAHNDTGTAGGFFGNVTTGDASGGGNTIGTNTQGNNTQGTQTTPGNQTQRDLTQVLQQIRAAGTASTGHGTAKVAGNGSFAVPGGNLTCAGPQACSDKVTATAALLSGHSKVTAAAKKKKAKTKKVTLAQTTITVAAGKTVPLKLKLTKAGMKALQKAKKLKVSVTVKVTSPGAVAVNQSYTITLVAPKKKK